MIIDVFSLATLLGFTVASRRLRDASADVSVNIGNRLRERPFSCMPSYNRVYNDPPSADSPGDSPAPGDTGGFHGGDGH